MVTPDDLHEGLLPKFVPAMRFTLLRSGVHLHVRTCAALFRTSGAAGRIALKFGILLEAN